MNPIAHLRPSLGEKLLCLVETVSADAARLCITDGRLFAQPITAKRVDTFKLDIDLAEWVGPAIDNLARAERLG